MITARNIPPFTLRPVKTAINMIPKMDIKLDGACKSPMLTIVAGLLTISPALLRPMRAKKADTRCYSQFNCMRYGIKQIFF